MVINRKKTFKNSLLSSSHYLMTIVFILFYLIHPNLAFPGEEEARTENIVLGMSTALSGPTSFLGLNMKTGVMAAIREVNDQGGIGGVRIKLICLDDGYEPARTAPNMRELIYKEKVIAIIGNVGTPTAVTAIPIAVAAKTTFFGAFTGAGILRKTPPDRYVINYRSSYAEEVGAMIDALIERKGLKPDEIAFFTQRDAYGDAGFVSGIEALKKHGLKDENLIVHSQYERNTMAVENGLADIILSNPLPKAVIMVGTYGPCAEFIRLAKQTDLEKALFLTVSFVGTNPLARELGKEGNGVIITQVVPHFDSDLKIVASYKKALSNFMPTAQPSFSSLEGYIAARILIRGLWSIKTSVNRETVVEALEKMGDIDIGLGVPLFLGPNKHQACHYVWPTILLEGKAIPFDWKKLKDKS